MVDYLDDLRSRNKDWLEQYPDNPGFQKIHMELADHYAKGCGVASFSRADLELLIIDLLPIQLSTELELTPPWEDLDPALEELKIDPVPETDFMKTFQV